MCGGEQSPHISKVMNKKLNLTQSKIQAIRAFINLWLSDNTIYCNSCGDIFNAEMWQHGPCCENPQIGRNLDHAMYVMKIVKEKKRDSLNRYGSNKNMTMRSCVSLPARLLRDLETYFRGYGEKLFNNDKEMQDFMRAFPQFTNCEEI